MKRSYQLQSGPVTCHNHNSPTAQNNPYLYLQGWRWRQYIRPKRWYLPTSPHSVTIHNTNIDISPPWEPQISYNAFGKSTLEYIFPVLLHADKVEQDKGVWHESLGSYEQERATLRILFRGLHSSLFLAGDSQVVQLKMNDSLFAIYWTKNNYGYTNT
jgi:hypothetical protein